MTEEVITEAAPVETIENAAPVVESTAEQQQEPVEQAQEPEAKPERTFTQDELDKIVQKRLAKESRRIARQAETEAENRWLRQQIEAQQKPTQQPREAPTLEQFSSYEDYLDARQDWKLEQRLAGEREESQQTQAQQQQQQETQAYRQRVQARLAEGAEKYADFDEVVTNNPDLRFTDHMVAGMMASDVGIDVAHYLGEHVEESVRIARLDPASQIRELFKLEAKVTAPPKTTSAPPPIVPSGQSAKVDKNPADYTDREWADWVRKAQRRI